MVLFIKNGIDLNIICNDGDQLIHKVDNFVKAEVFEKDFLELIESHQNCNKSTNGENELPLEICSGVAFAERLINQLNLYDSKIRDGGLINIHN
jgi:hypothetical protein